MSASAMSAANAFPVKRPLDRLVAVEMAKMAQDDGQPTYWGMIDTLVDRIDGAARRSVQRSIARLVAAGRIVKIGIHSTYRSVRYLLAFAISDWRTTQANVAQDVRQNGAHMKNRRNTDTGRDARTTRAPPRQPDFNFDGGRQGADHPQPERSTRQPDHRPPDPPPAAPAEEPDGPTLGERPEDIVIEPTALGAVGPGPDDAEDWTAPASPAQIEHAVCRVRAEWQLSKRPGGFFDGLRRAFSRYSAPLIDAAIDRTLGEAPWSSTLSVGDFVKRADKIVEDARHDAIMASRWREDAAAHEHAKAQKEQAERESAWHAEHDAAETERRESERCARMANPRSIAELYALIWLAKVTIAERPVSQQQCCAILRLAERDLRAAGDLTVRCMNARHHGGPAVDLSGHDVSGHPVSIMAERAAA